MADYSKEYTGVEFEDFSIKEIFNALAPDTYIPQICEGFGFLAIARSAEGVCQVAVPDPKDFEKVDWKEFDFATNTIKV